MRRSSFFLILLLITATVFLVFSIPPKRITALASFSDIFSFNFARNITTFSPNFQNVSNTYTFAVNIRVYIQTVLNQSFLSRFTLSLNDTSFITVNDGVITQSQNIFFGLQPLETLMYDASATPIPQINNSDTVKISYITEIYEAVIPSPPPPLIIIKFPLDLKITQLPTIVYQPFQQSFTATIKIINMANIGTDVAVKWWLIDIQGKTYEQGAFTVYVDAKAESLEDITILTPNIDGTYTLYLQSTIPTVVVTYAVFEVTTIPLWLIIAVILFIICLIIYLVRRFVRKRN